MAPQPKLHIVPQPRCVKAPPRDLPVLTEEELAAKERLLIASAAGYYNRARGFGWGWRDWVVVGVQALAVVGAIALIVLIVRGL